MTRTKEVISLEMKVVMRRWVVVGVLALVITVVAVGAAALLSDALGRSSLLVRAIPHLVLIGCTVGNFLLTVPIRDRYADLKLERVNAPSKAVVSSS